MTESAVAMRQLMRVKLADDADRDQAHKALTELREFGDMLESKATEAAIEPYALLKKL